MLTGLLDFQKEVENEGPMSCASITQYEPCPLETGCQLKPLWSLVRDTIAYVLEQTTLDDLLLNKISLLEGDDLVVFKK